MNGEWGGIGRTWWVAVVLIAASAGMVFLDKLMADQWLDFALYTFYGGVTKSALQGVAGAWKDRSTGKPAVSGGAGV